MKTEDPRIESILAAITKIAAGNLDTRIKISDALDEFDGVATGINMLAEEVSSRILQHEEENKQLNDTIAQLGKVKAQLSDSEHIFSQVFQTSPDGISISRLETGDFVEVNRSFEKLTGYTRDELIGKSVYEFGMWADRPVREKLAKQLKEKGVVVNLESDFRVKDGGIKRGLMSASLLDINNVPHLLAISRDISERKKTESVQHIMYNISNAVNLTKDLNELFLSIQKELGSIFDTTNFFIAFYNKEDDTLTLPFFVDEKDSFEAFPAKKSLTGYMIRNDKPILMKDKDINKLVKSGEIEDVGTPSKIWLGAPLKIKNEIIGALVVQHYEDELAYTEKDLEILQFVSSQIGLSIESKRAYDDVHVEKAYFEQLFEGSPETIVLTSNHGKLIKVNSEFKKLFGYAPEEAIGNYIDELIVPNNYMKEARSISRKVAKGEKIQVETMRQHKDGNQILVSVMGTPIVIGSKQVGVYGIYRNITDRKKADIALRESEEKLRNILYSSPDAITVSDLRGYITECNQAALNIFECDDDSELIGINANQFVIPEMRRRGIESIKTVLRNGSIKNIEFEIITKKGKLVFVDLSASLIRDANDKPIGIATITQDISEQKAYERNLEEAKEKAEESDRLKSAFLANMSHEIRTPMNAILGFSELLRSDDIAKEVRDEYTKIIHNKGNELMLIINDIIDISKIEAGDVKIMKSDLAVNDFLKQMYQHYNREKSLMNKDHIQFRLHIPEMGNPTVHTDPARLKQVLYNLINNALKFTLEGFIEIGYTYQDPNLEFYVRDTGIGVTREKQQIIFDRFRQVDESLNSQFGGTGLGLAISRNLVNLLGGEMRIESEEQQGSTFYFTLPMLENNAMDLPVKEVKYSSGKKTRKIMDLTGRKILIAEDDSANYLFIETFLKQTNADILWARDGKEALEIFKAVPSLDMILMDLKMPDINGIDATRTIRKLNQKIPVIAITAYAFADDKENSIKAGCNAYLAKPVKIEQLSKILSTYLK
jgi:PAS domain S-box-containing protein